MALMLVLGSARVFPARVSLSTGTAAASSPGPPAWALNCVRILALILIGDAGAPAVAAGGFHSEAGWISFIVLSAGLLLASQHTSWITVAPARETDPSTKN